MKPWRVVSFHTDDNLYNWHVERLRESLVDHGIENYLEEIPRDNGWIHHVNYKPVFILKCLEMFEENIVWLDADAVVQQYPALFDDIDADIAVHYKDGKELLSGTVFIANNDGGRKIVQEWVELRDRLKNDPHAVDQQMLQTVLSTGKHLVRKLPAPYTLIFDLMSHLGPPVIEHFQASRKGRTM
jgi:hypothetical protein